MRAIKFHIDPGYTTIDHPGSLQFLHTDVQDQITTWWLEDRTNPRTVTQLYTALTGEDLLLKTHSQTNPFLWPVHTILYQDKVQQ